MYDQPPIPELGKVRLPDFPPQHDLPLETTISLMPLICIPIFMLLLQRFARQEQSNSEYQTETYAWNFFLNALQAGVPVISILLGMQYAMSTKNYTPFIASVVGTCIGASAHLASRTQTQRAAS